MLATIKVYGCGACGPRNFYGTTKEHLDLEEDLMKAFNTTNAIVYSYGNNTLTSVIPVYAKKGDVVLVDELCNYPIQLGCRLSKAKIVKFRHNDIYDLTRLLSLELSSLPSENFISIVTEGVFQNDFSIAPLDKISKLKAKNVLIIL